MQPSRVMARREGRGRERSLRGLDAKTGCPTAIFAVPVIWWQQHAWRQQHDVAACCRAPGPSFKMAKRTRAQSALRRTWRQQLAHASARLAAIHRSLLPGTWCAEKGQGTSALCLQPSQGKAVWCSAYGGSAAHRLGRGMPAQPWPRLVQASCTTSCASRQQGDPPALG